MNRNRGRWMAMSLAPLLFAWQGGGTGRGEVTVTALDARVDPSGDPAAPSITQVDGVARIQTGGTQIVLLVVLPGERDAVLTLKLDADWGTALSLPTPDVSLTYEEFTRDGETAFLSERAVDGRVETIFRSTGAISLALDLTLEDEAQNRRVEFNDVSVALYPDVTAPEEEQVEAAPAGANVTASSGGCEDDAYDGGDSQDQAWNTEGTSPESSGGCDGDSDSTDTEDSSSGSGCEGDDVDSSSDSGSDSCDGDAAAAGPTFGALGDRGPRRVRATWAAKLVAWLPYLLVLVPLGLRRRARRSPMPPCPTSPFEFPRRFAASSAAPMNSPSRPRPSAGS